ncbi:MAG: hypothetical protein Q8S31_01645 [Alphaproteobacteria bacterium]|nr:hypothetical protein [Alphaproteobacteria bacterium]
MSVAVNIPDDIFKEAKAYSSGYERSISKQIAYCARIGKIAEENPDLSFDDIKGILLSIEEDELGLITEYQFNES